MDNDDHYNNEQITRSLMGRSPSEIVFESNRLNLSKQSMIDNLMKVGYNKRFMEYQNQIK